MSTATRTDPLRGYNFVVSILDASTELLSAVKNISKTAAAGFSECSGLDSSIEFEEYKEGGNNSTVLKFPTRATYSPIVLKRGVGLNDNLWNWHNGFILGSGQRRDGLIILQNDDRQPVKIWAFYRGLPSKYRGPSLNAAQNNVAIEELEIVHEGLALIPSSSGGLSNLIGTVKAIGGAVENLFG